MAAVVTEIAEGRIPKDRIALKCLYDEMKEWPFLDSTAELTPGGGTGAPSSAASSSAASSPAPTASDYATLMGENGGLPLVRDELTAKVHHCLRWNTFCCLSYIACVYTCMWGATNTQVLSHDWYY